MSLCRGGTWFGATKKGEVPAREKVTVPSLQIYTVTAQVKVRVTCNRFQKFGKALVLVLRNLNFLLRSVSASIKQRCVFNLSYVLMAISVELKQ